MAETILDVRDELGARAGLREDVAIESRVPGPAMSVASAVRCVIAWR